MARENTMTRGSLTLSGPLRFRPVYRYEGPIVDLRGRKFVLLWVICGKTYADDVMVMSDRQGNTYDFLRDECVIEFVGDVTKIGVI